jgi:carbon storage regulator
MLVLTRKVGEEIVIAGNIHVTILEVHGDRVRVGVKAPPSIRVDRAEVHDRRHDTCSRVEFRSARLGELYPTVESRESPTI